MRNNFNLIEKFIAVNIFKRFHFKNQNLLINISKSRPTLAKIAFDLLKTNEEKESFIKREKDAKEKFDVFCLNKIKEKAEKILIEKIKRSNEISIRNST